MRPSPILHFHKKGKTMNKKTDIFYQNMFLVYVDDDGEHHFQPWQDILESGGLIDPVTQQDMELIGWCLEERKKKMSNPIEFNPDGGAVWTHLPGDVYICTGVDVYGKRFPAIRTTSWPHAHSINLYRGTKWLERNGKRYRIYSVYN